MRATAGVLLALLALAGTVQGQQLTVKSADRKVGPPEGAGERGVHRRAPPARAAERRPPPQPGLTLCPAHAPPPSVAADQPQEPGGQGH